MNLIQYLKRITRTIFAKSDPWSKLILLSPDDPLFQEVKKETLNHPNILFLKQKLSDASQGIPSLDMVPADFRRADSFYWILRFFSDLKIFSHELSIEDVLHRLQLNQNESGLFLMNYHEQKQQSIELVCMTAHLTECFIGMGKEKSRSVETAIQFLLSSQKPDGSWHCDKNRFPGERDAAKPGCPGATLFAIRALSYYSKETKQAIRKALRFLAEKLEKNYFECPWAGAEPAHFEKLRYPPPFFGLDLLNVFDTFSLVAKGSSFSLTEKFLEKLLSRLSPSGLLISDKRIPAWRKFDFAHNKKESTWLTAIFVRAINRLVSQ